MKSQEQQKIFEADGKSHGRLIAKVSLSTRIMLHVVFVLTLNSVYGLLFLSKTNSFQTNICFEVIVVLWDTN